MYDIVEVDYEKLSKYRNESISFRGGAVSLDYLYNYEWLSDLGIYLTSDFLFHILVVSIGDQSFRYENDRLIIALFKPEKILRIIKVIIENPFLFKESKAEEDEIQNMKSLLELLEKANSNGDLIECTIG
ncbi:hypothetical protein JKA74_13655 [Marivirga sp. S37H4]|uniref:Uncharacterized protein n=1 Tax=Marivirga aurantiaca TaxID=2802615 RepID=A0A934WZI4_9BACT|nr:hypothetical protein [Marivirga aurantiaca]MBK6266084.1 hypothetical protein [Marivirga aurantiaca]